MSEPIADRELAAKIDRWQHVAEFDGRAGAPVGNALYDACNEIRQLAATVERVEALAERWERGLWADRYAARDLRAALRAPHSPAEPLSPVSEASEVHGGAGEAQEGSPWAR
jgi:hypothetical protein